MRYGEGLKEMAGLFVTLQHLMLILVVTVTKAARTAAIIAVRIVEKETYQ
jgi:hypothetical protein